MGLASAAALFGFLKYTKLGWAVRATAQDREAALQMGVDVDRVNSTVFAIASALGGLSGLLVGMYYNHIDPGMSFQATLKGVVAQVIGGVGNVPGAVLGSLVLGLIESYGIALFGTTYRNLFAFVLLIAILVWRPNGLFGRRTTQNAEPLTGTFIAPSRPVRLPAWSLVLAAAAVLALPLVTQAPYLLQTLTNAWLAAMLALSLTLIAGTAGQISLGHAALLAIGAYASALLALDFGWSGAVTIPLAGLITGALGTLLVYPAFRLRGHYVAIATLAIGEVVGLVILNWESLTQGALGLTGIPPLSIGGRGTRVQRLRLLALPRNPPGPGAAAMAAARLASRPHPAGSAGRRRRGPVLRHRARPLQGDGVRLRRLRGGPQRRHHGAPLFPTSITRRSTLRCRCWH